MEFGPVHRMGIGHPLFLRPLHRTLDQFSHVPMWEQCCILNSSHLRQRGRLSFRLYTHYWPQLYPTHATNFLSPIALIGA